MEVNLLKYGSEVIEFFNADTLKAIDYGVLDLGEIQNFELKEVLTYCEKILTYELKVNYMENNTGVFRVSKTRNALYYRHGEFVLEASDLFELKELVLKHNKIWYVFDETLAQNILRR